MHRPPPFAALRALEAACRHRSYTAAAQELNVTHSAVSQAVRRLEEELGAKLFFRRGSAMEPAAASLALAKAYAEASRSVGQAMRHVSEGSPNSLTLSAPSEIARYWLSPLLSALADRFPDVALSVRADAPEGVDVDLILKIAAPGFGQASAMIAPIAVGAYAAPSLAGRLRLTRPKDVQRAPLIIEGDGSAWREWLAAAGVDPDGALRGLNFDERSSLAVDAAIRGLGVVLCDQLSVGDALERGDLVEVCPEVAIDRAALHAVWSPVSPKAALVEELARWLAEVAGSNRAHMPVHGGHMALAAAVA